MPNRVTRRDSCKIASSRGGALASSVLPRGKKGVPRRFTFGVSACGQGGGHEPVAERRELWPCVTG